MKCAICEKTSEETTLYPGILATRMVKVCAECAEDQKIPIIKKPSTNQLDQADKHYSVRERLDRMQGRRKTTEISDDQLRTQNNLARLKMPKKKQYHPDVQENYYWELNMARRRTKMTLSQLAKKIGVSSYVIQEIERGILPENFKEIFLKLEAYLGIKLLKVHAPEVSFTRKNEDKEKEILETVAQKMKNPETELEEEQKMEEIHEKIEKAEMRLSRKEDIENVTLNDLIDRKRKREKKRQLEKQDKMMGDDIEIDEL
jgi:ribosome-binding protein aMBF1 (putative translation factor)